jgi:hypothetical protein
MTLNDFLPYVQPELPGCPIPTIQARLGSVLDAFCRQTLCWTQSLEPVRLVAGQNEYEVETDAPVYLLLSAACDGQRLELTSEADLRLEIQAWASRQSARPSKCFLRADGLLMVSPTPSESGGVITAQVAQVPKRPVSTIDDQIARHYVDGIASGVLSRLMAMPGTTWSQPSLVAYHDSVYMSAVNTAMANQAHGFSMSDVSVRPRRFI